MSDEKKFELNLDKTKKILYAKAFGIFGPNDANSFVTEYISCIKAINAKEYTYIFDCKELKVSGKDMKSGVDMTQLLRGCVEQYKKDGFKEVIIDCGTNHIVKMQTTRIAREVGLLNFRAI